MRFRWYSFVKKRTEKLFSHRRNNSHLLLLNVLFSFSSPRTTFVYMQKKRTVTRRGRVGAGLS